MPDDQKPPQDQELETTPADEPTGDEIVEADDESVQEKPYSAEGEDEMLEFPAETEGEAEESEDVPDAQHEDLIRQAEELGLDKDRIEKMTPEALETLVRNNDWVQIQRGQQAMGQQQQAQPAQPPNYDAVGLKKPDFDDPNFDPEKWVEENQQAVTQLRQQHDQYMAALQQHAQAMYRQQFGGHLSSLGGDWADVYGGEWESLTPQQFQARVEVDNAMAAMAIARQNMPNARPLSDRELFLRAHRAVHGDKIETKAKQSAEQSILGKVDAARKQAINSPSTKRPKLASSKREKADVEWAEKKAALDREARSQLENWADDLPE